VSAPPSLGVWALAFLSICLSAAAQLLMKVGMVSIAARGEPTTLVRTVIATAFQPQVFLGLACYGLSAALWLAVLSRMPLSLAYPLVSLAIVIVVVSSSLFLGETLSLGRIAGTVLIVAGVALVGLKSG
jgi:drug/metabolite transporter (DMT)-like permease